MAAIKAANSEHAHSYGKDWWSQQADKDFQAAFGREVGVYYVFNGTAANVLALDSLVASHESILCARTSHLWQDECGAPQRLLGSQVIPVDAHHGKIGPAQLLPYITRLGDQHASQPRAVSITQPTELGTLYSLEELHALGDFCRLHKLAFHMDGARITQAAAALGTSLDAVSFAAGVDVLSFGGTKHGLLHAEAVIFKEASQAKAFKFRRKQAMQLPSKTRFMAAQFSAFLENELWRDIALHSNRLAQQLRGEAEHFGEFSFPYDTQASSVFACIPKNWVKPLRKMRFFYVWEPATWLVRFSFGFDSDQGDIENLMACVAKLQKTAPALAK